MNNATRWSLLLLLGISSSAYALPPPDAVVSLWQSSLQFLGMVAVFFAGAALAVRQFFAQYIVGWKRKVLYAISALLLILLALGLFLYSKQSAARVIPPPLSIENVINLEKDQRIRAWKLQTLHEMEQEANATRLRKHLPPVTFAAIYSEDPEVFANNLRAEPKRYYVLDIREDAEREKFSIPYDATFRYGDLVHGIMPQQLPKDKVIMVLCHSGLRGYLGANFIQQSLFNQNDFDKSHIVYMQGGLAEWNARKLPVKGTADYKATYYPLLDKAKAQAADAVKIQVDADGVAAVKLAQSIRLPYETASSSDLQPLFQATQQRPAVLVCKTYGGCFHTGNLAYLIEQHGGKISGIYDETNSFMEGLYQ